MKNPLFPEAPLAKKPLSAEDKSHVLMLGGTHYAPFEYLFHAQQEGAENWRRRVAREGARAFEARDALPEEPPVVAFVRVTRRR